MYIMNRLNIKTRAQILHLLCEGSSMRSVSRIADVSFNTVKKILIDAGRACSKFHDEKVQNVKARRVQCDEIWSFTYAKQKNVERAKSAPGDAGDTWTWTAIDADSKLIVSWLVGGRDAGYATEFMQDLAGRLANRVQLTSDGLRVYLNAVEDAFGADIDYAMLIKHYNNAPEGQRRYSPAVCTGATRMSVTGDPNEDYISTSYVERQNLTMRMHMRRFTRLTNGFSKKFEHHMYMVALYTVFYNFIKVHKTLRVTPAMEAGLTDRVWTFGDIVEQMDKDAPEQGPRGPYKKRNSK